MKKNKSGFTLTEVLMVIVIVGFILAMTVHTFNSLRASYTSLSYFTYKNVGIGTGSPDAYECLPLK